jgi:hypothetical protein
MLSLSGAAQINSISPHAETFALINKSRVLALTLRINNRNWLSHMQQQQACVSSSSRYAWFEIEQRRWGARRWRRLLSAARVNQGVVLRAHQISHLLCAHYAFHHSAGRVSLLLFIALSRKRALLSLSNSAAASGASA